MESRSTYQLERSERLKEFLYIYDFEESERLKESLSTYHEAYRILIKLQPRAKRDAKRDLV